ncbi:putative bifunctional diguanylate cyclase/phosphodiesterase [Aquibacillus sediminis]|uniref:putative bifunctional diguanylate cyclase/phosphodiesterase n=1 Tax=Aquibacillus sediminis TaxID=2574734 RepID=UPI001107D3E8|nr:GGDEF domain-containing phosphodiesterase [Aquibacillus sediminis]
MTRHNIQKIPLSTWMISSGILLLSLFLEVFSTPHYDGLFWVLNLISVSLFSFHLGLLGGVTALVIILSVRIGVDFQQFSSLPNEIWTQMLIINGFGFVTSILIGYLAGKLRANERNMQEIIANNDVTFWSRNLKTGEVYVTEGNAKIYGVTREDFDRNPNFWFEVIHADDQPTVLDAIKRQKSGQKTKIRYRIIRSNGDIRWVEDRGTPIINHKGTVIKAAGIVMDITNQKQNEEKMNKMAYLDALTGLPNRNWFQHYVDQMIDQAIEKNNSIAVMFIDFDNFKRVNDTLGHRAGDDLLKQMAVRLKSSIRKHDIISRQGGDEFLVLIENTTVSEVEDIARRILTKLNASYNVHGTEVFSTPSIGISVYPGESSSAESLIEKADFAMYLAKENGKNNYQFYNDELNRKMKRKLVVETHLHKAIEQDEFQLYYQPQINLATGCLVGAEALIRWNCELGNVKPDEFIPIAEETGLIVPIGEYVIRQACRDIKQFDRHGLEAFPVSVNISTKQLMNLDFIDRLIWILDDEQVDAQRLTLEITESTLLFYEEAKTNIMQLRNLGIGISIDDFGVGYSSLSMIKDVKMDELKIDQSFLNDALEDARVYSLLKTIISIGKQLQAKIVVEGIETAEQLEMLIREDVYGQGYFYSRPVPISHFEKWYHAFYPKEVVKQNS